MTMKNIITFAAFIALFTTASFAQNIGIKVGANMTNTRIDGVASQLNPNTDFKTGFVGGVFSDIALMNGFSFHPEVNFIQKGFVTEYETDFEMAGINIPLGASAQTNLNFIEAEPLFKYAVGNENVKFYALAGPSIGYAINGKVTTRARALFDFNVTSTDLNLDNDMYNRIDIAGNVGVGTAIKAGTGEIFADVRYQHSFSSGLKDQILNIDFRNSGVSANVGYAYHF